MPNPYKQALARTNPEQLLAVGSSASIALAARNTKVTCGEVAINAEAARQSCRWR
jgi:hypothetical protein